MKACPLCKTEYPGGEVFCPLDGARLTSPSIANSLLKQPGEDPLVGIVLHERYKILRRIGEGGMGIVYEATHVVIEKKVALKVLRDDFSSRPEVVERFRQEAKSASRIGHEHIVDISDFGETPSGASYFVMEMLVGEDLADLLAREGTLAPRRAAHILIQCCKALGAAHSKGIVHRDMKPENIFLITREDQADFVKIVDFGIAKMSDIETAGAPGRKLTKTGMIFGTPEYMSPEQAAGKALDHRVDIYAMGVILYELLTGRVPFVGDTFMGVLTQHMFEEPPPLRTVNAHVACPPELEAVIFKALSKDAAARFQSMDEMARAIATAMEFSQSVDLTEKTFSGYGEPVKAKARGPRILSPQAVATQELPSIGLAPTEPPPAPRAKTGLYVGGGLGLVIVGIAIAWFATRPPQADSATQIADAHVNDPQSDPNALPGVGDAPPALPDVPDAGPAIDAGDPRAAIVYVLTVPEDGATVTVANHPEISCPASPCQFDARAGDALLVRARKGRLNGEQAVVVVPGDNRIAIALASHAASTHNTTTIIHQVDTSEIRDPLAPRR
ncbi:MAG: serine/threonine protein kinase [Sandaracinaceae bacterium]|nr:serine/threonine protein kinase [Sandaracinaceae bacterium]